jgi:hypothetical protein
MMDFTAKDAEPVKTQSTQRKNKEKQKYPSLRTSRFSPLRTLRLRFNAFTAECAEIGKDAEYAKKE